MNMAAQAFANYLNKKDIKYTTYGSNNEIISIQYSGTNMSNITVLYFFSTSTRDVAIRILDIARIPEEKMELAYFSCCKLNEKYRWVKFYINSDNEMMAESDAIITPSSVGEVCYDLLQHMKSIVDESYPLIMKTVWS